jgi:hypothetical protein
MRRQPSEQQREDDTTNVDESPFHVSKVLAY